MACWVCLVLGRCSDGWGPWLWQNCATGHWRHSADGHHLRSASERDLGFDIRATRRRTCRLVHCIGRSSAVRCLSVVQARRSRMFTVRWPAASPLPRMLPAMKPSSIRGNRVRTSIVSGMAGTNAGASGKGRNGRNVSNEKAPEIRGFGLRETKPSRPLHPCARPFRNQAVAAGATAAGASAAGAVAAAARRAFLIIECIVLVGSAPLLSQ